MFLSPNLCVTSLDKIGSEHCGVFRLLKHKSFWMEWDGNLMAENVIISAFYILLIVLAGAMPNLSIQMYFKKPATI